MKKNLNFQEKELFILREAVDKAQQYQSKKIVQSAEVKEIILIVEDFLRKKKLICYGGTAINNILPSEDQFYDRNVEIPDYDFFSPNAMEDSKELADIYYKAGYEEVEAKSGQHYGTYKVFVNFIPVADVTHLDKVLYKTIHKHSIRVSGIYYAPPNFLRMAMYLELSRPAGDVGRWEKVLKRLVLLNKNYPLHGPKCEEQNFRRSFEDKDIDVEQVYNTVKHAFISQGVVFFGGFANSLYSKYMPKKYRELLEKIPDFDVLSEDPEASAIIVKERLMDKGIKHVKIVRREGIGEIIAPHFEVRIGRDTVAFIYKPLACHSYNTIHTGGRMIKVATIDTMLSLFLAFLYADRPYYDSDRILCMAQYLFKVQSHNRLKQKGLLRRFSINCYGDQETKETMRAEKSKKFKELKSKKNSKEFQEWFLRYIPAEKKFKKSKKTFKKTIKKRSYKRRTRKRKSVIEF